MRVTSRLILRTMTPTMPVQTPQFVRVHGSALADRFVRALLARFEAFLRPLAAK